MKNKFLSRFFKDFFLKYKSIAILVFLIILAESILITLLPYLNKLLIDETIENKDQRIFSLLILSMLLVVIFQMILSGAKEFYFGRIGEKILHDMRTRVFSHVIRLPQKFFDTISTGELLSRIETDVSTLQQVANTVFIEFIANIITMISVSVLMFYMNWKLTLVSFVFLFMYYFNHKYFSLRVKSRSTKKIEATSIIMEKITEMFLHITTIKLFCSENWAYKKVRVAYDRLYKSSIQMRTVQLLNVHITYGIVLIGYVSLWYIGGLDVLNNKITVGSIMAFTSYQSRLFSPLRLFSSMNNQIQSALASLERIYYLLDYKAEMNDQYEVTYSKMESCKGKIEFNNVTFSYNDSTKILNDVNFVIEQGEVVALLGPSGIGKSSIAKLLMRLYENYTGKILIDGVEIKDIDLKELRSCVSIVQQDIDLFRESIFENISLGNFSKIDENVEEVLEQCEAIDFIHNLPEKYDELIFENGSNISGGQKRKLGIARALLKNSNIVIFDEATNSLDYKSRLSIMNSIKKLKGEKTVIIITHNIDEVENIDKIFYINDGNIELREQKKEVVYYGQ